MRKNSKKIHVLLVPGRGDKRRRHRFLEKPLIRKGIKVTVAEASRRSSQYLVESIRQLRRTANATHVIFIGGDWANLILIFIYRLFSDSIVLVRFGGHPTESRRETAKAQLNAKQYWGTLKSIFNLISTVLLLRVVHGAINVSAEACNATKRFLSSQAKCFNIPQTVSISHSRMRNAHEKRTSEIKLLTVANLNYRTKMEGIVVIVRGLLRVVKNVPHAEMPRIRWRIAGSGRHLEEMQNMLNRFDFTDKVELEFLGYVNDVKQLYEEANIFVYCSRLEGLPNVLLEAMSFGLPILINRYSPFYEVLKENEQAFYFDEGSLGVFEKYLRLLWSDGALRKRMGERNIEAIGERYSEGTIGKELFRILQKTGIDN